jgi:inositol-phosphate phosphatase/L-galactose 1-phosphate phosphatase/histidinol-phosphatase
MSHAHTFLALAESLADVSAPIVRRHFRTALDVDDKADKSPVTLADREVETALRARIREAAPSHGIIGEEHGRENEDAEFVWVLDPIDGTKAFITGRPTFGTLIALLERGRPVLGILDQPITGERWVGVRGEPTRHGGRTLRTRACASLAGARLSTTGPQYFSAEGRRAFEHLAAATRFTTYGGDCYQYGLLAMGGIDLVVEGGLKLYDFAALVPIVEGAGGIMSDWAGRPLDLTSGGDVIACGDPSLHAAALARLAESRT